MVAVSYGGVSLHDDRVYYIYIADLEGTGSLAYSGSNWALASYDSLFAFQSTTNNRPRSDFQFKVTHLGAGRFQLSSGDQPVRSSQTTPIDIGASIYNNGKKKDDKAADGGACRDDFDCPGTLVCEQGKCMKRDMPGGYTVNSGKRYGLRNASDPGANSNLFFDMTTRACKWTVCLTTARCNVLLLNPGTEFEGGDGWEDTGIKAKWPEGSDYCGWAHEARTLCCPKDSVARVNYTFASNRDGTNGPTARFGALAAGSVQGRPALILKVVDVPNASSSADVAFCGVTDYRIKSRSADLIAYTPMLLPMIHSLLPWKRY